MGRGCWSCPLSLLGFDTGLGACRVQLWWVSGGRFPELGGEEEEGKQNEKEANCSGERAGPSLEALTGQAARSSPRPPNNPGILSCDPLSRCPLNGPLWRWPPRLPP